MIEFEPPPTPTDDIDVDDDAGEWLSGLERVGLPVRHDHRRPTDAGDRLPASVSHLVERSWGIEHASSGVRALVERSLSPATRDAYEADWLDFVAWCRAAGVADPLDARDVDVAEYVAHLTQARLAVATIRRRLAGIAFAYELMNKVSPSQSSLVRRTVIGAARTLGTAQDRAAPLRLEQMRRLTVGVPIVNAGDHAMRRDQLLVALGWASALRCSELVALDVEDLHFVGDPDRGDGGVLIRVRRSKTDQAAASAFVAVPYSSQWASCPVRLALSYSRRVRTGPLFRHIDRHGKIHRRLSADAVSRVLKSTITELLDVDATPFRSHSLRAGFVTEARSHGVPDELIARHTRHRHTSTRNGILDRYDRPTDLLERTPFDGWW